MNQRISRCSILAFCALALTLPLAAAPARDIVQTAAAAGSFRTFSKALQISGLADTLRGRGPFTVFAPTDEAFAQLPPGTVEAMLKPQNHRKLLEVLTYHIVPGRMLAQDVRNLRDAHTVNGKPMRIVAQNGRVKVEGVNVIRTNIVCSNGVIHAIDSVLLPQ